MKKKRYYTLDNIMSVDSQYKILFGERSNGKSYAVKMYALKRAYEDPKWHKFIYLRRWREDIVNKGAEEYFNDMEYDKAGNERIKEITNGEYDCIAEWSGSLYFAKRDENGKKVKGVMIGKVIVMTGDTHHKSRAYVGYENIIFEEFITDKGYLADDVKTLMSIVSTVLREDDGNVFMIGNTLTEICPYFKEWELVNVPKQKQGSIDIYTHITDDVDEHGERIKVKIACEYCENSMGVSKMIFGNKMISHGEWYSEEKPHLPLLYSSYKRHLSVMIDDELKRYVIDLLSYERHPFLYIREDVRKWTDYNRYDIILTVRFNHDAKYITNLSAYPKIGALFKRLFDSGKVCYQDNLIGTSFTTLLNDRKIF